MEDVIRARDLCVCVCVCVVWGEEGRERGRGDVERQNSIIPYIATFLWNLIFAYFLEFFLPRTLFNENYWMS